VITEVDLVRDGFGPQPKFRALIAEWEGQAAGYALFFGFYSTWEVLDWNQPAIDFYQRLGASFLDQWKSVLLTGEALERAAKANENSGISIVSIEAKFSHQVFRTAR